MNIHTVSEVSSYLKQAIEADPVLRDVWVKGEISNLATPPSGHSYFSLHDKNSILRCVMFRNSVGAEHLENGSLIITHGRLSLYEVRGDLQLIADLVHPEGTGEKQLELEQLAKRLKSEGLFDDSRKRTLPKFPSKIGVITSPAGAVWHDIQTVVSRRYPLAELILAPSLVQGDEACEDLIRAIVQCNQEPDIEVLIIARGGGSFEDLSAFNEERLARAVFASRIPIISAIGHETDVTLADMVADKRAATPSAAAELAVPDSRDLIRRISFCSNRLHTQMRTVLNNARELTLKLPSNLIASLPDIDSSRITVDEHLKHLALLTKHHRSMNREQLGNYMTHLRSLDPAQTLQRGYSIIQDGNTGEIISNPSQAKLGVSIEATIAHGQIRAVVTDVRELNSRTKHS